MKWHWIQQVCPTWQICFPSVSFFSPLMLSSLPHGGRSTYRCRSRKRGGQQRKDNSSLCWVWIFETLYHVQNYLIVFGCLQFCTSGTLVHYPEIPASHQSIFEKILTTNCQSYTWLKIKISCTLALWAGGGPEPHPKASWLNNRLCFCHVLLL